MIRQQFVLGDAYGRVTIEPYHHDPSLGFALTFEAETVEQLETQLWHAEVAIREMQSMIREEKARTISVSREAAA